MEAIVKSTPTKIMEAALTLVREKGYHAITMDEIAMAAGMSKGALYWHYGSKKDLFLKLIDHWVAHIGREIAEKVEASHGPEEALVSLFAAFAHQFREHPAVFAAETEFWSLAHRDAQAQEKVASVYGDFLHLIEKLIRRGIESGLFIVENPRLAAVTCLVSLEASVFFTLFNPGGVTYIDYVDYVRKTVIPSLIRERRSA